MQYELPTIVTCGVYDSKIKHQGKSVSSPRVVEHYELDFYDADSGISAINGTEYHKKYGSILFAKPGDTRYSHLPLTCKFIRFKTNSPVLISRLDNIQNFSYAGDPKKTNAMFDEVFRYFYSGDVFDSFIAGAKLLLLINLISTGSSNRSNVMSRCSQYVKEHYTDDITIKDIASSCSVSLSYLHKLFKTELNVTPGEYLLNYRIAAAKNLLINTNLPLNEVAVNCGFNSQSYFSDCFKRNCGISPNTFRKNSSYLL